MARRSCALIGPGRGPQVQVRGEGKISIRGLKQEEFAQVSCYLNSAEDVTLSFTKDGVFDLHPCAFASVNYQGSNRRFIACILIGG